MRTSALDFLDDVREILDPEDWPLLAAVMLLPWAFGGVEVWAFRGAAFLVALAGALALWRRGAGGLGLGRTGWLLPAGLLGLWAGLQIVPLPPAIIELLSPTADAIYRETFPGYPGAAPAEVAGAVEQSAMELVPEAEGVPLPPRGEPFFGPELAGRWDGWRTLSLLPQAGGERLAWYIALLMAFLLIRERVRDPERMHAYRNAIFGNFIALALIGLIHAASGQGTLLWVRAVREDAMPFGPYVNPDHFAGLMEMAVLWLAGCALAASRREGGGILGLARTPIFSAGTLICLGAALAAASKAAAALLAVGLTLLAVMLVRRVGARVGVLVGAATVLAGLSLLLRESRLGERFAGFLQTTGTDIEGVDRFVALKSAVPMFRDYLVAGSGFGSFREVFSRYLPPGEYLVWEQLHNDYFEVLTEGGLIAGVLLAWIIVVYWSRVLRPSAWRGASGVDLESVGMTLGLATLSVHALLDFNHQIPANAMTFVVLAGMLMVRAEGHHARTRPLETAAPAVDRRRLAQIVAFALVATFGIRAIFGVFGGVAYAKGAELAADGYYEDALPYLDRAIAPQDPAALLWLRGQVRHGLWEQATEADGHSPETDLVLHEVFDDYARAIAASPASGWYLANLAEIYQEAEVIGDAEFPVPLDYLDYGRWAFVGRPGRVAIGLCRLAVRREPNSYVLHDGLAEVLFENRIDDLALEAVAASARVQPIYHLHPYRYMTPVPEGLLDTFAEASRGVLGATPLLRLGVHLTALGRVEVERDNFIQAEEDLRRALDLPGHDLDRAEAWYWLGYALGEQERYAEAAEALTRSREHPNMETRALDTLADLSERRGDFEGALELLRELRRLEPRELSHARDYARVAVEMSAWAQAEDALKWAIIVHPEDLRPRGELFEVYLLSGDLAAARRTLAELESLPEAEELVVDLRGKLAAAAAGI